MRYVSQLFQPILTIPKNAKIKNTEITCKSQKLLLECGLVRPTSSGLFTLLPLAQRALDKLEALVVKHIESTGAQRISFPSLVPEGLWEKSGRLEAGGPELLSVRDRHDKKYLLAPTHEESVADLLADVGPLSYRQLPLMLYQLGNKYRDEHRPKHGLLRARTFRMMDAYSAHADEQSARERYEAVSRAYAGLFDELRLTVHRVEAPTGEMGGSLSHEWQCCAEAGEDSIDIGGEGRANSVEVGHTFVLGTKYSAPLKAMFTPASGPPQPVVMCCYGIGITRLLATCVEALSTEQGITWPRAIAPYSTVVIGPKEGSKEWQSHGFEDVQSLAASIEEVQRDDVLVDDRHNLTIGKRVMMADKMGYPTIVVCGKRSIETPPRYEVLHQSPPISTATLHQTPPRSTAMLTRSELLHSLAEDGREEKISVQ